MTRHAQRSSRNHSNRPNRPTPRAPEPASVPPTPEPASAPATPEPAIAPPPTPKTTIASQVENYTLKTPRFAQPAARHMWLEENVPEFVAILLQAVHHFKIDGKTGVYPKHHVAMSYFLSRRLSDGRYITPRQARALATFCRPVKAMSGGNSKPAKKATPDT